MLADRRTQTCSPQSFLHGAKYQDPNADNSRVAEFRSQKVPKRFRALPVIGAARR